MFKELYKNNNHIKGSQEERRQQLLEKQKQERRNIQDDHRSLEEALEENQPNIKKSKPSRSKNSQQKQDQLFSSFRDIYGVDLSLQQSEWLRECPSSINDWLLVPCPRGQRSLVVAYNRQTAVYNKVGKCVCIFRSLLPGDGVESDRVTILDCIYLREQNCFYVLDVLAFGGTLNLMICEAEFRFFWIRSKLNEDENLSRRSIRNQKPFHIVKHYDFEYPASIAEAFQSYPLWPNNKPELDGFLFYNRFAHYTCGTTPLVGWLFAFMIPDLLNMEIDENYVKPEKYTDALSYMDEFDERLKIKWERSREREEHKSQKMVTSDDEVNEEDTMKLQSNNEDDSSKNDICLMLEDDNPDIDDENSLEKVLKSQMELELL